MKRVIYFTFLSVLFQFNSYAQGVAPQDGDTHAKDSIYKNERLGAHFQFTTIGQHQLPFNAPYSGRNSLLSHEDMRVSITSTLFLGARLWKGAELYFDPELSGGRGISSTTGVAGFPNGEVYRVGNPEPVITVARIFLRQTFNLGGDKQNVESQQNQLKGSDNTNHLTITFGKFSIADMFDNNSYSHDPRNQFMNWAIMSAGAWDYPANTRGYTYGAVIELFKPTWGLKLSSAMVPEMANGPYMDMNIGNAHSETVEFDKKMTMHKHDGMLRVIVYNTFADMGNYKNAINDNPLQPDVTTTREYGRTKTGFVINAEQEITNNVGLFGRLSWNDGKNETWAFTEIDRSLNVGLHANGAMWKRPTDVFGAALLFDGLSKDHRDYLADGGYGFIIGDGRLNYGIESILELYYNVQLFNNFFLTPDYQFILNPAYNKDRGPVNVFTVRAHVEF